MDLGNLIAEFSTDPFNPEKNFKIALEYEALNQTASAVSFYLRAAEYGYESHPLIVYTSLIKMSQCFKRQGDRAATVFNNLSQALTYLPERPEAYFFLANFHEGQREWQQSYSMSVVGMNATLGKSFPRLPAPTGYYGSFCLKFQKAISAWWVGRRFETQELLLQLADMELPPEYHKAVHYNLEKLEIGRAHV